MLIKELYLNYVLPDYAIELRLVYLLRFQLKIIYMTIHCILLHITMKSKQKVSKYLYVLYFAFSFPAFLHKTIRPLLLYVFNSNLNDEGLYGLP